MLRSGFGLLADSGFVDSGGMAASLGFQGVWFQFLQLSAFWRLQLSSDSPKPFTNPKP